VARAPRMELDRGRNPGRRTCPRVSTRAHLGRIPGPQPGLLKDPWHAVLLRCLAAGLPPEQKAPVGSLTGQPPPYARSAVGCLDRILHFPPVGVVKSRSREHMMRSYRQGHSRRKRVPQSYGSQRPLQGCRAAEGETPADRSCKPRRRVDRTSLHFSPWFVARRRRWLRMQGVATEGDGGVPEVRRGARWERNAADAGRCAAAVEAW
jgi:hypothetical protein